MLGIDILVTSRSDAPAREPRAGDRRRRSATDPSPKDVTLSDPLWELTCVIMLRITGLRKARCTCICIATSNRDVWTQIPDRSAIRGIPRELGMTYVVNG